MDHTNRFIIDGLIVRFDTFRGIWKVIQRSEEGKLEVSYRWFRSCKEAEEWCIVEELSQPL